MNAQVDAFGLTFDIAGFSECGPRDENEDVICIDAFREHVMVVLADGMGGVAGGREAAELTANALRGAGTMPSEVRLRDAFRDADRQVRECAALGKPPRPDMGAAAAALALTRVAGDPPVFLVGHCGDCRVFSCPPCGPVRLETTDHNEAWALWQAGEVSVYDTAHRVESSRLLRAVGTDGVPDIRIMPIAPDWTYLLATDGAYAAFGRNRLERVLGERRGSAATLAQRLQQVVLEYGPTDNFSAIVIRVTRSSQAARRRLFSWRGLVGIICGDASADTSRASLRFTSFERSAP